MGAAFSKKDVRLLVAGLDSAGKTTILYKLKRGKRRAAEPVTTIPTLSFNVDSARLNRLRFSIWDVGGQDSIRPLWRHYYTGTQGLIFVVDANDGERIQKAAEELHTMVINHEMRFACVLVFANKTDLPHSLNADEVAQQMRLHAIRDRRWHVQPSCATSGEGLWEGMAWLASNVKPI